MLKGRLGVMLAGALVPALAVAVLLGTAARTHEGDDPHGWLGVGLDGSRSDLPGVGVVQVFEDSPAEEVGLEAGDRIVSVNGTAVEDPEALIAALSSSPPGERVELGIRGEDGASRTVVVTLAERPEDLEILGLLEGLEGMEGLKGLKGLEGLALLGEGPHRWRIHCEGEDCEDMDFFRIRGTSTWLGVELIQPSDPLREHFGAAKGEGVLVNRVLVGSPAESGGLRAGDMILSLGDAAVASRTDLLEAMGGHEAGDTVTLTILRDGSKRDLSVELGENPHRSEESSWKMFFGPNGHGEDIDLESRLEIQEKTREALERAMAGRERALAGARQAIEAAREGHRETLRRARERYRRAVRIAPRTAMTLDETSMEEMLEGLREQLRRLEATLEEHREELKKRQLDSPDVIRESPDLRTGLRLIEA